MMAYVARTPFARLLLILFIPVLLLSLLTVSPGVFHSHAPEGEPDNIKRYEHVLAHPVRAHSAIYKSVPSDRSVHHGITSTALPEPTVPVLCVSLFPIIYIILKRLLLHPLKYTSTFI